MHFTQNSSNKQTPETNTVQASTENPALSLRYGMRRSLRRTFFRPECQSRGWGICKVCTAWGPGIYQPRGHAQAFDLPAVSYQNITTQKVLLKKMQIGSSVKDRNKLKRVVKACSRFHMYVRISSLLILSQNYVAKLELSMWINVFWLLNQISVDIIWRTSFHIYKTIHNI